MKFKNKTFVAFFALTIFTLMGSEYAHAINYFWNRLNAPGHKLNGQICCFGESTDFPGYNDLYHDHLCPQPKPSGISTKSIMLKAVKVDRRTQKR